MYEFHLDPSLVDLNIHDGRHHQQAPKKYPPPNEHGKAKTYLHHYLQGDEIEKMYLKDSHYEDKSERGMSEFNYPEETSEVAFLKEQRS